MLRLGGFLLLTLVVFYVLRAIPVIGSIAGGVPLLGFFVAAAIASYGLQRWGEAALQRARAKSLARELGAVDKPYNKGKLGSLLLKQKRYARAVPLLAEAAEGEPDSVEWRYNLGRALLGARRAEEAVKRLEEVVEREEEHAYGAAMMRLAEARLAAGDAEGSLEALDRVERNHGESPESAFRRGLALRAAGRRGEARRAFGRVGDLARDAVGYQKREAASWTLRAGVAKLF